MSAIKRVGSNPTVAINKAQKWPPSKPLITPYPLVSRQASHYAVSSRRFHFTPTWALTILLFATLPHAHALEDPAAQFATSLFTDFAPILALFGEEVSKQYISQSIGWIDDILFAMAPLGILTIVVGAIRVAGYRWMRNLIGRAREPSGVSEMEYLSSTSENVYEIWDKKGVVRKVGNERIQQILFDNTPGAQDVMSMWNAEFPDIAADTRRDPYIRRRDKFKKELFLPEDPEVRRNWDRLPPNLTLNAHAPIDDRFWIKIWALVAVVIQLGVIAFQAVVTYRLNWRNPSVGRPYESAAFPLACGGLVIMCTGVFICAWVIESSTQEVVWIEGERSKEEKKKLKVMWVQQNSGEGAFESYAIYRDDPDKSPPDEFRPIWGSYLVSDPRSIRSMNLSVVFGTIFCSFGFLAQVIGLRGLHFSATLAQFLATLVVSVIRSFVRRGLSASPHKEKLEKGYELDQVALRIAGLRSCYPAPRYIYWKDIDEPTQFITTEENPIVEIRAKLAQMTNWTSSHSSTASDLYKLILETLNLVEVILQQKDKKVQKEKGTSQRANKFSCIDVPIDINGRHTICDRARASFEFTQRVVLKLRKDGEQWASDPYALYHLEALISLWMYSFIFRQQHDDIHYSENLPSIGTLVSWNFPDRILLLDFLTVIGHGESTKTLINLCQMNSTTTQNIVEIVTRHTKLKTKEIPRNQIPIFLDNGIQNGELSLDTDLNDSREPVFVPLEHLFGHEYDGHNSDPTSDPLFAYRYVSSPANIEARDSKEQKWREYVGPLIERIFAQQIYRNFVFTLRDMIKVENGSTFGLSRKQIEWLIKSFTRDKLGSAEQGYLCLFPLWDKSEDQESGSFVAVNVIL